MTNTDMSKMEKLMYSLFPSARMFSETGWDIHTGNFIHYLDTNNAINGHLTTDGNLEVIVIDKETSECIYRTTFAGEWREIMDNIIQLAERVGVKSIFYQ